MKNRLSDAMVAVAANDIKDASGNLTEALSFFGDNQSEGQRRLGFVVSEVERLTAKLKGRLGKLGYKEGDVYYGQAMQALNKKVEGMQERSRQATAQQSTGTEVPRPPVDRQTAETGKNMSGSRRFEPSVTPGFSSGSKGSYDAFVKKAENVLNELQKNKNN